MLIMKEKLRSINRLLEAIKKGLITNSRISKYTFEMLKNYPLVEKEMEISQYSCLGNPMDREA